MLLLPHFSHHCLILTDLTKTDLTMMVTSVDWGARYSELTHSFLSDIQV